MDPAAGAKKMLTDAEAMEKGVEDKNKAEADIMEGKKVGLQKQASEQAERDASEEVGRVRRGDMTYVLLLEYTRWFYLGGGGMQLHVLLLPHVQHVFSISGTYQKSCVIRAGCLLRSLHLTISALAVA